MLDGFENGPFGVAAGGEVRLARHAWCARVRLVAAGEAPPTLGACPVGARVRQRTACHGQLRLTSVTSITLGAFTFAQRMDRYNQRIFPALAAYNASQFNVDGWLLAAGGADIDTFAEAIPFTETYPYVQRIYENYRQYLDVYAAP